MAGTIFYFDAAKGTGWAETYHFANQDYPGAGTALDQINTARCALLPSEVTVLRMRISDVAIRGDAFLQTPTTPAGTITTVSASESNLAVLCRFYSNFIKFFNHFLRGIPTDNFTNGNWTPTSGWIANAQTWATTVMAQAQGYGKPFTGGVGTTYTLTGHFPFKFTYRKTGRPFGQPRGRRQIA
jgi:hypothetical protein